MNIALAYLNRNWERLQLEFEGSASRLISVMKTPRFRASAHVIFLVVARGSCEPLFVVKVPRIPGDNYRLDREVSNLYKVQSARVNGFKSIPKVVAYEDFANYRLLILKALHGQIMRPSLVRKQTEVCIQSLISWLIELHEVTLTSGLHSLQWFDRLVRQPLRYLEDHAPLNSDERRLVDQVREIVAPLEGSNLPLVFEHGDLSSPNILISSTGRVGVVDWELAEPHGLPAADLFFFLTYIAFARARARDGQKYLRAFQSAFFGRKAWALNYIDQYCKKISLSANLLKPLFVVCWTRYMVSLLTRLSEVDHHEQRIEDNTLEWLRTNRYYLLWNYTVEHIEDLAFG